MSRKAETSQFLPPRVTAGGQEERLVDDDVVEEAVVDEVEGELERGDVVAGEDVVAEHLFQLLGLLARLRQVVLLVGDLPVLFGHDLFVLRDRLLRDGEGLFGLVQFVFRLHEVRIDVREHADHAVQLGLRGGELGLRFREFDLGVMEFRERLVCSCAVEARLLAERLEFELRHFELA